MSSDPRHQVAKQQIDDLLEPLKAHLEADKAILRPYAERTIDELTKENAQLRTENTQLRKQLSCICEPLTVRSGCPAHGVQLDQALAATVASCEDKPE